MNRTIVFSHIFVLAVYECLTIVISFIKQEKYCTFKIENHG